MAEVIGEAIVAALAETGAAEGLVAFGEGTFLGVSGFTAIGTAAILATTIGLQYALTNPNVPPQEQGAQPLKQGIVARRRGYWINRLSGPYMLYLAAGGDSQDMIAFHQGRIEEVMQIYLHDQAVTVNPAPTHNVVTTVAVVGADQYRGVQIEIFYGLNSQSTFDMLNTANTSGVWTPAFAGKGIACLAIYCGKAPDPQTFTRRFQQGNPLPSVVCKCSPVWDPRDLTQSVANPATWKASPNGVLSLMDYITLEDGGMGEDRAILFPPAVVTQWMAEAALCDNIVAWGPRYQTAGWYEFGNTPENVIGKILASMDGWLAEAGDGTLALTVGYYREPTDPPIQPKHIVGIEWQIGVEDESAVYQMDVTWVNPAADYVSDNLTVRNDAAITAAGNPRNKPLDLSFVQNEGQAENLAERALLRANPEAQGILITTEYGLRYMGKRWIKVTFPSYCGRYAGQTRVVEIQDRGKIDLMNSQVTFNWIMVDPDALLALQ